ncbi:cache domain-containing protein [Arthrobacter sulfonylureivorans]|uniref:cache domain-containing protein n=1 Tax=Arthrobacter sulfonylureivorans TaxID=2486855 RepID=UPI0039E5BDBB
MSSPAELAAERHAEPLADVTGFFEEILAEVASWVPVLAELFADPARPPGGKQVTTTMQPLAAALVKRGEWPVVGAGFVAADQVVADAAWHMAWWQGETMERLVLPALASASDAYMRREWFTRPMATGRPHVTGPYVDFLCTDEYTMTMTVPVAAGGRRVGVAGADVFVESLEPLLLPALKKLHPAASLVNHVGRVVVSADAQLAAGTLLAPGAVQALADQQGGIAAQALAAAESSSDFEAVAYLPAAPRTVLPRGEHYPGFKLTVLECGRLPLAVVYPEG